MAVEIVSGEPTIENKETLEIFTNLDGFFDDGSGRRLRSRLSQLALSFSAERLDLRGCQLLHELQKDVSYH